VSERAVALGRRFARVATRAVVGRPRLWRLFRAPIRKQFDWLAPQWEGRRGPDSLAALEAALARMDASPRRVLDLGTGTGLAARFLARRFPDAEVVGVDLSPAMIEEARRLVDVDARVRFEVADASALRYADGAFDLVVLLNMIPFFHELARLTAPGGSVILAWSSGPETPIYVPPERVRAGLEPLGFDRFEEIERGPGTAVVARRRR
jgi:SAM-dependent methyltransferase